MSGGPTGHLLPTQFVGDADYNALRTLDFQGMREMMPSTDESTLKFIFRFFDDNHDNRISTAEFLMAVAMLCQPCESAQEQLVRALAQPTAALTIA